MKYKNIKRMLFGLFVTILWLPALQQFTKKVKVKPLDGAYTPLQNPTLTFSSWFNGSYGEQISSYLNEQIGFRPFFVRLYNEVYYRVHNQARANDVIIGKEKYLYGKGYIDAYLGADYMGDSLLRNKINKLAKINDTLRAQGIELLIMLAPGKGSFYPEFLPNKYVNKKKQPTNYSRLRQGLSQTNIHYLDFKAWFDQMKLTTAHPLFPKTGIHWSKYGEVLVMDSLLNYLKKSSPFYIGNIIKENKETSRSMRDTDDDIEKGMNILSSIPDLEMGYYNVRFEKDSTKKAPSAVVIADSYYWGMHSYGFTKQIFNGGEFWYYFNEIHKTDGSPMTRVIDYDTVRTVLEQKDLIIYISTDANLSNFGFGFIDRIYREYYPHGPLMRPDEEK